MADLDSAALGLAIDALYEAAADPGLWQDALGKLSAAAGGTHSLVIYGPQGNAGWYNCTPDFNDCLETFFREGWQSKNIRFTRGLEAIAAGHPVFSEEILFKPGELDRQPIQAEFFRRFGLRSFFGFDYVPGAVQASIERGDHEIADWELEVMKRALPHFRRLGHLALARGNALETGALSALDMMRCAAIVIDYQGQVVRMNADAERLYGSVLRLEMGQLSPRHYGAAAAFDRLIKLAISPDPPHMMEAAGAVALPREERLPVLVRAAPLPGGSRDMFQKGKAILMLSDPEDRTGIDLLEVRLLFGMTPAEASIAGHLARGRSPQAIASDLGVSKETIRTHIRSIFQKTGTARQAELVALLMRTCGLKLPS